MGMREGSDPLALSHGDCNSWLLLLSFLRTNSPPRMREGSDPLALSRGTAIRGSCFFRFFSRTRRRGCERVPTLSRSPVGLRFAASASFVSSHELAAGGCERVPSLSRSPVGPRFAAPASFVSSHELAAGGARGFRPSRALPWGLQFVAPASFVSSHELAAGGARGFRPSRSLPWGRDSRLLLLLFLRTDSPPGDARGFRPSCALPRDCDSRLSTSFASPFVFPYSSGMRTISDWGGTVTAVDSFLGCAESRFAERKSVWVTASGRVTRMSRSDERLYTR